MALFTDGAVSGIEDLMAYESAILEVATTEQIDLTIKLGLAQDELGINLEAFLSRQRTSAGLGNVIVTEPLKKWHTFHALAMVYRDAYHRQLNDRYEAKWNEYIRLSQWAREALNQTGLGLTDDPIPRAAKPQLSYTSGISGAATYYVRVAWRNIENEEGAPSDIATLTAPDGNALVVTPVNPPASAVGWNVYVGFSAEEQTRQNTTPIAVGAAWTAPASGIVQGTSAGAGQTPEYYLQPGPQVLWGCCYGGTRERGNEQGAGHSDGARGIDGGGGGAGGSGTGGTCAHRAEPSGGAVRGVRNRGKDGRRQLPGGVRLLREPVEPAAREIPDVFRQGFHGGGDSDDARSFGEGVGQLAVLRGGRPAGAGPEPRRLG